MERSALFAHVKAIARPEVDVVTVPDADYSWLLARQPQLVLLPASTLHYCRVDDRFCELVNEFRSLRTLGPQRTPEERSASDDRGVPVPQQKTPLSSEARWD